MGGGLGESLGDDEYQVPVDPMEALQCESCQ
jgi:hypothetical protein